MSLLANLLPLGQSFPTIKCPPHQRTGSIRMKKPYETLLGIRNHFQQNISSSDNDLGSERSSELSFGRDIVQTQSPRCYRISDPFLLTKVMKRTSSTDQSLCVVCGKVDEQCTAKYAFQNSVTNSQDEVSKSS